MFVLVETKYTQDQLIFKFPTFINITILDPNLLLILITHQIYQQPFFFYSLNIFYRPRSQVLFRRIEEWDQRWK